MRKYYFLILCLLSVCLTGCYSHKVIGYLQEPTKQNKLPIYDSVPYEPYRIHVNDEIIYRVITLDATLSKSLSANKNATYDVQYANPYRVYADSTIDLPYLEPLRIGGLTEQEAQDTLRAAYKAIVPDADVKLALYNKYFTVVGDAHSGRYVIYKERMNIFQALAMTGDVMNSGDRRHIRIIRPQGNGEKPEVLEFDMRTNTIIDSKYYYIYPNDVIYVARTKDSFYKVPTYTGFLGLITSSVALLTTVLNYVANVYKK